MLYAKIPSTAGNYRDESGARWDVLAASTVRGLCLMWEEFPDWSTALTAWGLQCIDSSDREIAMHDASSML